MDCFKHVGTTSMLASGYIVMYIQRNALDKLPSTKWKSLAAYLKYALLGLLDRLRNLPPARLKSMRKLHRWIDREWSNLASESQHQDEDGLE